MAVSKDIDGAERARLPVRSIAGHSPRSPIRTANSRAEYSYSIDNSSVPPYLFRWTSWRLSHRAQRNLRIHVFTLGLVGLHCPPPSFRRRPDASAPRPALA